MNFKFKFIVGFVCLFIAISYGQTVWFDGSTTNTEWYTKNTSADIFYIETAGDLAGFQEKAVSYNFAGKTIILTKDIMLNDTTNWKEWEKSNTNPPESIKSWAPIGKSPRFNGTFDGNGHIISGVYMNNTPTSTAATLQGFFGQTDANAIIKNLGITASYIKLYNTSGALVGYNGGLVINCFSIGTIVRIQNTSTGAAVGVGGLIGNNYGTVKNCYSAGLVTKADGNYSSRTGGITGLNSGTINDSYYEKTAEGADRLLAGGTIGDYMKTKNDIQSQDFVASLNILAGKNNMNKWELSEREELGAYPILTQEKAPNLNDKFANNDAGTQANPWLITEEIHLKNLSLLASQTNLKGDYFKLGNGIELTEGNLWTPIGTTAQPFNGNFDGSSYVISGISTDQTSSYQGLFGYIGTDGVVKNVGVINSEIKGQNYVGGIAGYNAGTISNCYSTAKVEGGNYIGGFVGKNDGSIRSSYSVGEVKGRTNAGEFVGFNCETCKIIGGYIAEDMKDNAEFTDELNKVAALFSTDISPMKKWTIDEPNEGYPVLSSNDLRYNLASYFEEGTGKQATPYMISTAKQLEYLSLLVELKELTFKDNFFKLKNNIVLDNTKEWTPIGTAIYTMYGTSAIKSFAGTFDGNGKTISGIYINSNAAYKGLFGYISSGGTLKNIRITNSYVKGKIYIGGLVGHIENNTSLIDSCSFSGIVEGTGGWDNYYDYLGGLVGFNYGAKIKSSYSTGEVNGTSNYVGGLVGSSIGTIEDSYSTSRVTGKNEVGGLVGHSACFSNTIGNIFNSYSTGTVTGDTYVGGLVGWNNFSVSGNNSNIKNSYSTSTVTGKEKVGGLVGLYQNVVSSAISDNYATGNVDGEKDVGGLFGQLSSLVANSYSIGKVTGNEKAGGLIGSIGTCPSGITCGISNSYYDNTVNSAESFGEGGKSTKELKTKTTYVGVGWNFTEIWKIDEEKSIANEGYPYHLWGEKRLVCVADKSKVWDGWSCRDKTAEELLLSSSSVVVSSSSSVVSSSSKDGSSSSGATRPPQVIVSCDGFVEGTTREHFGKDKRQFCDKRDGKKYVYVTIGNQDWMAENLRYDYDQCGKPLGRCYGDDPANCEKYGMLYTIFEAEPDGWQLNNRQVVVENLCPEGWHIPSHAELATMLKVADSKYQKGDDDTGEGNNESAIALKTRTEWPAKWIGEDGNGDDRFGFSALPGGYCGSGCPDNKPTFKEIGLKSYWWTTNTGAPAPLSVTWAISGAKSVADAMQSYPYSRFYARCMRNHGEVAVVRSNKCAASNPDYSGFDQAAKDAYPDLDIDMGGLETIDKNPSSSSNSVGSTPSSSSKGNPTPILPQLSLGNISAHPLHNAIELQNVPQTAKVEVYNLQGKHIFTSGESLNRANRGSDNLRIQVHIGMYIIKVSLGSEVKILRVPVM